MWRSSREVGEVKTEETPSKQRMGVQSLRFAGWKRGGEDRREGDGA